LVPIATSLAALSETVTSRIAASGIIVGADQVMSFALRPLALPWRGKEEGILEEGGRYIRVEEREEGVVEREEEDGVEQDCGGVGTAETPFAEEIARGGGGGGGGG